MKTRYGFRYAAVLVCLLTVSQTTWSSEAVWEQADRNGELARQAFIHCRDFVRGWLGHADPVSGLIPRNLTRDAYWNARDSAADNYPFMVLTSALVDRPLFEGRMIRMLEAEQRLTVRVGSLPDDFLFKTQTFRQQRINMPGIIFGASEYVKDGLLPLTEWLGPSPWRDRMIDLVDGILEHAEIKTPVGILPATDHEVGGELMQVLSRLYWMTGKATYKDMALRYADYFLLHAHPIRQKRLSLDDHGCEVIGGLSEVYYLASKEDPQRYRTYRKPMYALLDRILEVGRNENGLFYMVIDPVNGKVLNKELTDNWGYDYNAFLTVAEVDNYEPYRRAVRFALENVHKHTGYPWEGDIADGYADSIESGLNLLNRIPVQSGFAWVEHETQHMLAKQGDDGVVAGWHGDGNYARTAIMVALWKTQGCRIEPWRADIRYGALQHEGELWISVESQWPWQGRIVFDKPRHQENFHMPADYPRLNQFPEWFTVQKDADYRLAITDGDTTQKETVTGSHLLEGYGLTTKGSAVRPGGEKPIRIILSRP